MRMRFWNRVLVYLFVLLSMLFTLLAVLMVFDWDGVGVFLSNHSFLWKLAAVGLGVIDLLLGVFVVREISPVHRRKNDFVTLDPDQAKSGQVRIAVSAIYEMVRQSVEGLGGMKNRSLAVTADKNALIIRLEMDITEAGRSVPELISALQYAIRLRVRDTCGVSVKEVLVTVNSIASEPALLPEEIPAAMPEDIPSGEDFALTLPDQSSDEEDAQEEEITEAEESELTDEKTE